MPQPTGLHEPITNIVATESEISTTKESPADFGFGEVVPLPEGAKSEPVIRTEAAVLFTAVALDDLSDIGVASFGEPPAFENVIGTDERVRITDTQKYPWRLCASLLITAADNSQWIGTGWFISPRTLITAGHVVYIKHSGVEGRDGWVKKIQVMPGRDANNLPFGGLTATEFFSVKGWGEQGLETYDYGAVILPGAFSKNLGHFAFGVYDDARLLGNIANVEGYPGDKPSGTLWYDSREIGSVTADKVYYAADTAGGQSGCPVYIIEEGVRKAVAIHAYGGRTANSGTRISDQVFENLSAWKRD